MQVLLLVGGVLEPSFWSVRFVAVYICIWCCLISRVAKHHLPRCHHPGVQWSADSGLQALRLNKYLERMLLALDRFTGLDASDHAHEKANLAHIHLLLSRIDGLRIQSMASTL